MGRDHITVGACTLCIGTAAQLVPWTEPRLGVVVTGLVLAGNVLPDIDHKRASVSTCWGPLTWVVCRVVRMLARWIYLLTRTSHDPRNRDPHRTATHTWPAAVLAGGLVAMATVYGGPVVATAVSGLAAGAAAYAYNKGLRWYGAVAGAAAMWPLAPEIGRGHLWIVLWVATALGCLTHCLADCTTKMGNPWAFPRTSLVKVLRKDGSVLERRQRWYMTGPPEWMRYETGGWFEKWFIRILISGTLLLSYWLVAHTPHWTL